ncbi:hypothetical protein ACROYT_G041748 [Oculina patagonica]
MLVGSRQRIATFTQGLNLSLNGISLRQAHSSKCLGIEIDEFLTWDSHISSVSKKVSSGIGVIKKIKPFVPTSNLLSVYQSIVEPYFDYCSIVWNDISDHLNDKLQKLQNRAARVITGADYQIRTNELFNKLRWSNLKEKRNKQKALMMFKIMNGMTPTYLEDIFSRNIGSSVYNLRTSGRNLALPVVKTDYYRKSFAYTGVKIWNALPDDLKYEKSMRVFKKKLESFNLSVDF